MSQQQVEISDYEKYRGKCFELASAACTADPSLTLVRGWYHCPIWGNQAHWWCVKPDGTIVDPTAKQFPSAGLGAYEPYDGMITCEYYSKEVPEQDACMVEHHTYCSNECYGHDIGF